MLHYYKVNITVLVVINPLFVICYKCTSLMHGRSRYEQEI